MATETKEPTLAQLTAAARKKWPRSKVVVNPSAPDAAIRAEWRRLNQDAEQRRRSLEIPLARSRAAKAALDAAARFVCDVDGDSPSIDQLRAALAEMDAIHAAEDERLTLQKQIRSRPALTGRRFEVVERSSFAGLPSEMQIAAADTF